MCNLPVTFGGGMDMENGRPVADSSGWNLPLCSHLDAMQVSMDKDKQNWCCTLQQFTPFVLKTTTSKARLKFHTSHTSVAQYQLHQSFWAGMFLQMRGLHEEVVKQTNWQTFNLLSSSYFQLQCLNTLQLQTQDYTGAQAHSLYAAAVVAAKALSCDNQRHTTGRPEVHESVHNGG